jgi:hypothetical protein
LSCNDVSSNPSIETPQVTIFTKKKPDKNTHMAIMLGAIGGTLLALIVISLSVLLYMRRERTEITYSESK